MDGALNPKTSLLIKIAQALDAISFTEQGTIVISKDFPATRDPEVAEWLDRMAELKFIRQTYMPETKSTEETL